MTEFERILRDHLNAAYEDYRDGELPTPAELDAYRLGAKHAIEEARALYEVELALELERRESTSHDLGGVFDEVRTTFAIDWENGVLAGHELCIVDETIDRAFATLDAMADCE